MAGTRAPAAGAAAKAKAAAAAAAATAWIDAYLAALPADQRGALQTLRETIATVEPKAVEAISYGIPAFRYRGRPLVWYHAAKGHCSFFPTSAPIEAYRAELAAFALSKGTVRFTPAQPLPRDLVVKLVRYRLAQMDADAGDTPTS
jgi:uncharacterized protein YdhG (YjbR/CyaY superfamily)